MNYFLINDWINEGSYYSEKFSLGTILQTELNYQDSYEMYEVFILICYKNGNIIKADDFVEFLNKQGIIANLIYLHKDELNCSDIEDKIAMQIQAL